MIWKTWWDKNSNNTKKESWERKQGKKFYDDSTGSFYDYFTMRRKNQSYNIYTQREKERESLVLLGVWNRNLQYKEKEKKKEGKIDVWERCLREKRNRCIGHLDFSLFIYLFIFFEKPDFSLGWCQRTRRQRKRGLGENFLEFWVGFCCICFV